MGSDRALKRLALQRVRDIDLWRAALVRVGESTAEARRKLEDADVPIALAIDERGRPLGWLSDRGLAGEQVSASYRSPAEPQVELDDILRDALADLLESETQYGPVLDPHGRVVGVLSLEVISHTLQAPPQDVPTGAGVLAARE